MGHPRPGRKKAVVISSDEDEDHEATEDILSDVEEEEENVKPNTRSKKASSIADHSGTTTKKTTASKAKPAPQPPQSQSQSQSQSSKPKGKAPVNPEPKRGNKSIYSFFNAATQRQQAPQRSASPDKSIISEHDHEDIQDAISGDEKTITLSKGSQTAMAMRKRKLHNDPFLNATDDIPPPATQKFRKVSDGTKVPGKAAEDRRPWTEQFAPVDLSELAVHKKKISDLRQVLESALSEQARPRLIVLKGAAGAGKTTAVNLLAKDLGVEVKEWRNPAGSDLSSATFVSAAAQFEDFILRSGRFTGLELVTSDSAHVKSLVKVGSENLEGKPQIMLVEEFPNTFAKTSGVLQAFRTTIQQSLASPRLSYSKPTPLVMIISETLLSTSTASADSFTAHRLLGPQILNNPQTAEIEFNAVAPTILTKALETIVLKEARKSGRRKTPGPAVLKHLSETGDIRSAISSLEFLCLRGDEGDSWSARIAFTKPKRSSARGEAPLTKQEQESLKLISNRESSLGIFHAVGKVVYNKRSDPVSNIPQPPNHLPHFRKPKPPDVDVDALINELGTDTSTFIAALHENYALSCSSSSAEDTLDALNGCLDALSDADLLSPDRFGVGTRAYSGSAQDNLRQDDLSFQSAVRGLLFALPEKVQRGGSSKGAGGSAAFRMFYPQSLKIWRRKEEVEGILEVVTSSLQSSASSSTTTARKGDGVESWRRNNVFDAPAPSSEVQDMATPNLSTLGSSARKEMLLERLPYTSLILSARPSTSPSLLTHMATLTSISATTTALNPTTLNDDEDQDAINENAELADWTTDRADADSADAKPKWEKRNKGTFEKSNKGKETEGGGLGIPIERAVEGLVLSDDDIVDD